MRRGGGIRSCALSCGAAAALAILVVVAGLVAGGWYLFRDSPTRPEETFPTGSEAHYVSVRLRPDDEGMRRLALALFARSESSFFAGPSVPGWLRSGREEGWLAMLPATVEWAAEPGAGGVLRVRFEGSHATARALFRVLRWGAGAASGSSGAPSAVDLAGDVPAVRLRTAEGGEVEIAFLGNRLLASREPGALETMLRRPPEAPVAPSPLRAGAGFPREDGSGWTRSDGLAPGCVVRFSLRLESDDLLRYRAAGVGPCPTATSAADRERVERLLLGEAARISEASGLEPTEPAAVLWEADGGWIVSGRVVGIRGRALASVPSIAAPKAAQGAEATGR